MKKLLVLLLAAAALGGRELRAETNNAAEAWRPNRYLFVVETSRAMQRRAGGLAQAVQQLLDSSMGGQFHSGDSLGLWTFNESLHTGKFPLQKWTPQNQKNLAMSVAGFLQAQTYSGAARFEKAVPALDVVVRNSQFITIVFFTTGVEDLQGTAFDSRVNGTFARWREQQRELKMPFVTILRARGGQFTDCTVTPFPWPIDLPSLPPELKAPVLAKAAAAPAAKPAFAPAQPLIVTGKKPAPTPVAATPQTNAVSTPSPEPTKAPEVAVTKGEAAAQPNSPPDVAAQLQGKGSSANPADIDGKKTEIAVEPATSAGEATRPQPLAATTEMEPTAARPANPKPANISEPAEPRPAAKPLSSRLNPAAAPEPEAAPPRWFSQPRILFVVLPVICLAGVFLLFLRARNRDSEQQISLITRSLDPEKDRIRVKGLAE